MTKTKSALALSNSSIKSLKNGLCCSTTLPNLRNKNFDEFHYESLVEKYNEKINLWQSSYLLLKKNYLYLYDRKPKTTEKPNEYLYLNNKISITFHRRLFKLKAIKNFVVNIKINNEALSHSLIEDNKHNIYLSFKTQTNYINFRKVFDNVLTSKQCSASINNKDTKEQIKKYKSYRHLKNKSESHIQIKNNLIKKNQDEILIASNNDKNKSYKSKLNSNSNNNTNNKNNNSFTNSAVHNNVFTFSKIECTNDKNNINSNSSKRSNSCNTNKRKMFNNLVIEEEKNIMSLKSNDISSNINNTNNNMYNSKKCINYFNVNFNENNLKLKYNEDDSNLTNLTSNNIFDTDFTPLLPLNTTNEINQRPYTSLVYSIRRKKEKEKEDVNRISKRKRKHRTNSCFRFKFNNEKYNNIFLNNNPIKEIKEEKKIKTIKIKLKDYHSFNTACPSLNNNMNLSDYSRDEKNINMSLMMNNTGTQELMNYSFNEIEEKNSECKSSKSKEKEKEKENDKTKNNTIDNTEISLGSLKSYKYNDSKEKSKEKSEENKKEQDNFKQNDNDNFEGMNIYSYIDASDMTKNKSNIEDNNPMSLIEMKDNNEKNNSEKNNKNNNTDNNITNIRSQISQIIKQKEEMISKNELFTNDGEDDTDTNIIFTSRLREEMTEPNSNSSKENINNEIIDNNNTNTSNNEGCSNIINTSNVHCRNHLRFSSDLNDIIQTLEKGNKNNNNYINTIEINIDKIEIYFIFFI